RRALATLLIAAILLLALPGTLHADVYVVQPGDTLSGIAERFGTTQAALLAANPHVTSPDVLWAGAELTIPDDASETAAATTPERAEAASASPTARGGVRLTHLVQPGDTLSEIAETYQTTTAAILALNPGYTADYLIAGVVLVILDTTGDDATASNPLRAGAGTPPSIAEILPGSSGESVSTTARVGDQAVSLYTVAPGDTFSGLAERAGVTQLLLARLNPHVDPHLLYVGETLFVPLADDGPAGRSTAPAVTTSARYEVVPGDTATGIAEQFGISLAALRSANPGIDLAFVYVGQEILVPGAPADRAAAASSLDPDADLTTYIVRAG
ncbi:MAG: LysM peptidoglycan-binding domain-containing protein, partial [Chloroflexota bacterium]|nr:LysM peptidoglycan-binding domain-containing protein [Chloroflexota bacterium]